MNAADTVVAVLVPAAEVPASSVSAACGECFGWGFVWAEVAAGELMPGADCVACWGTGVSW
ncbi:hypothetical protein OTC26_008365 [Streptomyces tirandamycinicus]|uniref:hypothetical protein n=1 Tax=Streptomyces tirandamycinicus TaxID=2174846 RepID=UPI002271CEC0|nr:hypothetical protein [Streptomyces tirandamycinicus]MCY0984836.1 hypothetical protein [Streptomyces tirandamycinicus]